MTFKSFIEGLDPRAFRVKQMPRQTQSAIVYEQVVRRRNEVVDLSPIDLDALAGMVRTISRTNRWDELDGKQLWHLPACLWSTNPPLASDADLGVYGGINENFVLVSGRSRWQADGV